MTNQPTSEQLKTLQDAMLSALRSFSDLQMMLRHHLGAELTKIVPTENRSLTEMVHDVIRVYAAQDGGLHRLLDAAHAHVPKNELLNAARAELKPIDFAPLPLPEGFKGGDVVHGDQVGGDQISGDKMGGDKVARDKSSVDTISGDAASVAVGQGSTANTLNFYLQNTDNLRSLQETLSMLGAPNLSDVKPPDSTKIRHVLANLGYREQVYIFGQHRRKPYGAFLISGPDKKCGQRWLLCRLLRSLPSWRESKILIKIDFAGVYGVTLNEELVWEKVAEYFKVGPENLMTELAKCWIENHIVFVFLNVTDRLEVIIRDFWLQIAKSLDDSAQSRKTVFMFISNDEEPLQDLDLDTLNESDNLAGQLVPTVRLPELATAFHDYEIDEWIDQQRGQLIDILQDPDLLESPNALFEEIWEDIEGAPMPTLRTVYSLCRRTEGTPSWSKFKKQWTEVN